MFFEITTRDLKYVSDYANLSFSRAMELDCLSFKILLRDAIVFDLSGTERGQEYLEKAYYITSEKPDRKGLSEFLRKGDES